MITLPDMPPRIARLPRDERGYPVPRFVQWLRDGKLAGHGAPGATPAFQYADAGFRYLAFRRGLCWICGDPTGVHQVYAIGPMCVINRITSEPASHRDCAEFAAKACPFLIHPREKRNEKNLHPEVRNPGGIMIKRNPGAVALYETRTANMRNTGASGEWLIKLGEPERVDWWAEGRSATREEILASIEGGYPLLLDMAKQEGGAAVAQLEQQAKIAMKLLPA